MKARSFSWMVVIAILGSCAPRRLPVLQPGAESVTVQYVPSSSVTPCVDLGVVKIRAELGPGIRTDADLLEASLIGARNVALARGADRVIVGNVGSYWQYGGTSAQITHVSEVRLANCDLSDAAATYPLFEGRIGHRSRKGALAPISEALVFVGWRDGACQLSLQDEFNTLIGSDGSFEIPVPLHIEIVLHLERHTVPVFEESVFWPCFRFHADGCDDATVQLNAEWTPRDIEMRCPARLRLR